MTKLVVGLTFVAILAAFVIKFRTIIGPLLLAFVLVYMLYPVVAFVAQVPRLSWRGSVNIIFLLVVGLFGGIITLTGLTVVQQLQSLINFVRQQVTDLPGIAAALSTQTYSIGPFELSLAQFDLQTLSEQLIGAVQPLLGRMGGLISSLATGAAVSLGWGLFILLVSYFVLADAGDVPDRLLRIEIPGYDYDVRRLGHELRKIWNAYLRGQLILIIIVILSYLALMLILGVRFAIGIAILAGVARFVPYIGPLTVWIVTVLVAFFQAENYFGLEALQYAILVVVAGVVLDQIFDNLVSPRVLGDSLGVHPAAVLVAAIVAANLIGVIGLVLAAPVLATAKLLGRYVMRKMFDLEPFPEETKLIKPVQPLWKESRQRLLDWWRRVRQRYFKRSKKEG